MFAKLRFNPFRWIRFTTRDAVWCTVVVALLCALYRPQWSARAATGRELDVRIAGQGYFMVEDFQSSRRGYVRNGRLSLNSNGQLCIGWGPSRGDWVLQPQITIPSDYVDIAISHDGIVTVSQNGNSLRQQVGQLPLARFINTEGLHEILEGIYEETDKSGAPMVAIPGLQGMGYLEQGRLDGGPQQATFDAVLFTCVLCCGAALVCVREVRSLRGALTPAV
jgi:hypothetical protein